MCCHGVCVQGLHSTGHLQHPTQELTIRVATLTHLASSLVMQARLMKMILGILAVGYVCCRVLLFLLLLRTGCKWWCPT